MKPGLTVITTVWCPAPGENEQYHQQNEEKKLISDHNRSLRFDLLDNLGHKCTKPQQQNEKHTAISRKHHFQAP